jgi:hypothetical protein
MEWDVSHRHPAHDDVRTTKQILVVNRITSNGTVQPEAFEYTPPLDSVDVSDMRGRGFTSAGSGGGGSYSRAGGKRFESWNSHEWAGPDTLIETTRMKFDSFSLSFERRLTFAEDRKSVEVRERVNGPGGTAACDLSIPLS